jgi:aminoglycoside 6'-N-acetyltransferase
VSQDVPSVRLTGFEPSHDLRLLEAWVRRSHVMPWWGDPELALAAARQHPLAAEALIVVDAQPVGYVCWQRPPSEDLAAAGLSDLPPGLVDVDILIGEPTFLGQGPAALSQLLAKLHAEGVPAVGLAAAVANHRALKAYEKAGFRPFRDFHEGGQDMRYFLKAFVSAV